MTTEKAKIIAQLLGSKQEQALLKQRAKAENLTVSNYLRKLCGFHLNQSYPEIGNTRAVRQKAKT